MKRTLFLSILIVFIIMSFIGCNQNTSKEQSQQPQQQEQYKQQPTEQSSVSDEKLKDDYVLQERCGKRSEEWVKSKYGDSNYSSQTPIGIMTFEYENHYNKKLNKCFVLIYKNTTFNDNSGNSREQELYDVNENKQYGFVSYIFSKSKGDTKTICSFFGENCDKKGGWYSLIIPYMEK